MATLSQILSGLAPVLVDAVQVYENPTNSQAAQQDALSRVETALQGASPKVTSVVNAAIPLAVAISQHPNPGQLLGAGLSFLTSFFPSSFSF